MKTLSTDALDTVTGGTPTSVTTSPITGGGNDQVLSTLQNIESSIKDLGKNNQGLFGGQNGALLMMTMAFAMSRRNEVVVYGGGGHHYWWRSW